MRIVGTGTKSRCLDLWCGAVRYVVQGAGTEPRYLDPGAVLSGTRCLGWTSEAKHGPLQQLRRLGLKVQVDGTSAGAGAGTQVQVQCRDQQHAA